MAKQKLPQYEKITESDLNLLKIKILEDDGIKCHYVRFHQPVPTFKDQEPVSEFRTSSKDKKYIVESITWTPNGVIFRANGEVNMTESANVIYSRFIV